MADVLVVTDIVDVLVVTDIVDVLVVTDIVDVANPLAEIAYLIRP